ncbi:isocitrate/isopropylmalate dehydrogenase family protein [Coriobacteriia bacterium Es71-Z0120]|uniref:isocitrate/isopropylmalate dehydrogenase family protein n=1 Tax=Parvivirga hydrogeniphila TaxID=2939460 RepID=UPI002260BFBD|nr:isocitrate/isopropylmalate dehydrogenase family protein [Parvivirga hydrogeniphila]MCL4078684.1 isocitrate/isopropylmalate dehydrogenase family protein [Parvivirga hydrogeniphila]
MAKHTVTLIPGDGIGPEITHAMTRVVEAAGVDIEWERVDAGAEVMDRYGTPLPDHVLESIRRNKVAIKGPITTPVGTGFRSVNVALRKELDLYACLRPSFTIPGTGARYDDVDLVIVRENTEDLYAGIEFEEGSEGAKRLIELIAADGAGTIRPDSGISVKPISVSATQRIVRFAFDYAIANGRKKVTAVHKANIMKHTDGLFLRVAREVAEEYAGSGIEFEDYIVDATCMQLVLHPEQWDVLVLPNLYGDIVSDLAAGLIGGLGIAPGANIGDECAVFEPVHGSAPKYAGKDMANPTAEILSAVLMLKHIGEREAAERVLAAVRTVLAEDVRVTYDIMRTRTGSTEGCVGTQAYADAIIEAMA